MHAQQRREAISRRRPHLFTATATAIVLAVTVSAMLTTSSFAKSARDVRRHRAEVREPIPAAGYGQQQRWPGAKYDQNGYYIDPNSPGRW
jgi:hypothetical protein